MDWKSLTYIWRRSSNGRDLVIVGGKVEGRWGVQGGEGGCGSGPIKIIIYICTQNFYIFYILLLPLGYNKVDQMINFRKILAENYADSYTFKLIHRCGAMI